MKKEEDKVTKSETNSASLITASDFDTKNYDSLTSSSSSSSGIIYSINNDSSFKNRFKIETSSSSSSCSLDSKLNNTLWESDGSDTYKFIINDTSITDCIDISNLNGDYIFSIEFSKVKLVDSSGNFINLSGKKSTDFPIAYVVEYKIKVYYRYDVKYSYNNSNVEAYYEYKNYASSESDIQCKYDISFLTQINCHERSYMISSILIENQNGNNSVTVSKDLDIKINKTGLEGSKEGIYYTNGTIDFQYINWNGTMTYGGNSSSAPTYTVTNGNDNLTGTYNYSSSRNLRKNSHQKFTLEDKFKEIRTLHEKLINKPFEFN